MNKQELTERLARRSRQSRSNAADKLDALIYKLWKESRDPKVKPKDVRTKQGVQPVASGAPVKKP